MRIKKVITPEHQAKLLAGKHAAKARREQILAEQDVKKDVVEEMHRTKDDIDDQLDSVHEDVALIRKLIGVLERALIRQEWGNAFRIAGAINALAASVSRRIEMAAAKADVINKLAEALKRSSMVLVLVVVLSACGSADEHPEPVAVESVVVIAPPAPPAPLVVVSKPAPVYRWRERERDRDDDDDRDD
jgi:hypothetical protein